MSHIFEGRTHGGLGPLKSPAAQPIKGGLGARGRVAVYLVKR